jgi:hypothetical protein
LESKLDFDFRPLLEQRDHEKRRLANIAKAQPQQDGTSELAPYRRASARGLTTLPPWERSMPVVLHLQIAAAFLAFLHGRHDTHRLAGESAPLRHCLLYLTKTYSCIAKLACAVFGSIG